MRVENILPIKRVLVTGANGFIGKALINKLLLNGNKVICLVRDKDSIRKHVNIEIIEGNILNKEDVLLALNNIDIVYHVAGVGLKRMKKDPDFNVKSTMVLVNSINTLDKEMNLIFVSSLKASLPMNKKCDVKYEEDEFTDNYGKSKLLSEQYIEKSYNGNYIIIRTPAVYGPHDHNFTPIFKLIDKRFFLQFVGYIPKFSIIYVDDLANILLELGEKKIIKNEKVCIAHEIPIDINNFISEIVLVSNKWQFKVYLPVNIIKGILNLYFHVCHYFGKDIDSLNSRKNDVFDFEWICNLNKMQDNNRLYCPTSLRDGVAKTWEWYKTRKALDEV